jgi:hypothetical protein
MALADNIFLLANGSIDSQFTRGWRDEPAKTRLDQYQNNKAAKKNTIDHPLSYGKGKRIPAQNDVGATISKVPPAIGQPFGLSHANATRILSNSWSSLSHANGNG